jgi:predicted metallopeptidase
MKYEFAPDLQAKAEEISKILFPHVKLDRVMCFRSYGTNSRGTIARCHTINKLMQKALGINAVYVLEFLVERFEKMSEKDKVKIIIHELMHIPYTFGGGFKHHNWVTNGNVNAMYERFESMKIGVNKEKEENDKEKLYFWRG